MLVGMQSKACKQSEFRTPTPPSTHRHSERRFHYHRDALGDGFFPALESAPTTPEPANLTSERPPSVPAEFSERDRARLVARKSMRVLLILLLAVALVALLFGVGELMIRTHFP